MQTIYRCVCVCIYTPGSAVAGFGDRSSALSEAKGPEMSRELGGAVGGRGTLHAMQQGSLSAADDRESPEGFQMGGTGRDRMRGFTLKTSDAS